jgi:hypothetical protein
MSTVRRLFSRLGVRLMIGSLHITKDENDVFRLLSQKHSTIHFSRVFHSSGSLWTSRTKGEGRWAPCDRREGRVNSYLIGDADESDCLTGVSAASGDQETPVPKGSRRSFGLHAKKSLDR